MGVATSHQTQEWLDVLAFLAVHIHCTIMNEIFFSLSIQSSKPNLIAWNVNSRIPPTRMPFENTPPRYASHFTTKCESKYRHNAARDTPPIPLTILSQYHSNTQQKYVSALLPIRIKYELLGIGDKMNTDWIRKYTNYFCGLFPHRRVCGCNKTTHRPPPRICLLS